MGVHERVLGAVAEQPGYGYRIVKELDDEYTPAAVYKTLRKLEELSLVELVEVVSADERPKKWYQATVEGIRIHHEHVGRTLQERLTNASPESIAAVVDEIDLYEQRTFEELHRTPPTQGGLIDELIADERRFRNQARLKWVAVARERINAPSSV